MLAKLKSEIAVDLSKQVKASRLIIMACDHDGNWEYATAGIPGEDERAVAKWANYNAENVILDIAETVDT